MRETIQRKKVALRARRKSRVRGKISGVAEKPRVSVFRSNKYFYAQAIDDVASETVAAVDGSKLKLGNNKEDVKKIAAELAGALKTKKIENVVFDRNGYLYHGVVASFAEALRENGLKF